MPYLCIKPLYFKLLFTDFLRNFYINKYATDGLGYKKAKLEAGIPLKKQILL